MPCPPRSLLGGRIQEDAGTPRIEAPRNEEVWHAVLRLRELADQGSALAQSYAQVAGWLSQQKWRD